MDPYLGQIEVFAFDYAPRGWMKCEGQLLPIAQYTALFSLLNTRFGGDGRSTFGLPDLRGRFAVGAGQAHGLEKIDLGKTKGAQTTVLHAENLPSHTHNANLYVSSSHAAIKIPVEGNSIAVSGSGMERGFEAIQSFDPSTPNVKLNDASIKINSHGEGRAFDIQSPCLGLNICIAVEGIFPPRS